MNKQSDKIVEVVVAGFDRIDKAIDESARNADMQRMLVYSIELAKWQEIFDSERLVMGYQLERLDRWTHELAKKLAIRIQLS